MRDLFRTILVMLAGFLILLVFLKLLLLGLFIAFVVVAGSVVYAALKTSVWRHR